MASEARTSMPQIGSVAVSTAAAGAVTVRWAMSWARIEIAMSAGVRAPMSRPAGVCTRERSASSSDAEDGGAALGRGDERDVLDPGLEGGGERSLLVLAVGGDDERGVIRLQLGADVVAGGAGDRGQGAGDRGVADDRDPWGDGLRVEEDLQGASAQAGVVADDHAVERVALGEGQAGQQAQQHALPRLQRPRGLEPHGLLRADAADEALDRAVGEDERGVAGADAGGLGGAHDRGDHEGHAGRDERFDAVGGDQGMASQTREGVHGMSMCGDCRARRRWR